MFLLVPALMTVVSMVADNGGEAIQIGSASYRLNTGRSRCDQAAKSGAAGATDGESMREGIQFNVRTPLNYDPTIAHPLLLVFAPAGTNRTGAEKTTGLTHSATSEGFIVAYADHPELSPSSTIELGTIPRLIAEKWCVDEERIFLTGHSDGGTVAMALAFMAGTRHLPKAIAPSAAGISHQDLYNRTCPNPLPVMIMHSSNDHVFPGYGKEAFGWWAACNRCDPIPEKMGNGCLAYSGCANGVKTWYCEGNKPHSQWPEINDTVINFFLQ